MFDSFLLLVVFGAISVFVVYAVVAVQSRKQCLQNARNKRILLCGASTGIGRELALVYAKQGAHLMLVSRSKELLDLVANDCRAAGAADVIVHTADLSITQSCCEVVNAAVAHFGNLDILVLNHIKPYFGSFQSTTIQELQSVLAVNFASYLTLTHTALPHLLSSRGSIVAVSSVAGKMGIPYVAIYSASKHAIHGLFDSLRLELDLTHPNHGVGITTCVLGNIDTESAKQVTAGHLRNLSRASPVDTAQAIAVAGLAHDRELYYPYMATYPGVFLCQLFPTLIGWAVKKTVG